MSNILPETVLRLKQGSGRVIRTRHDRGLMAILGLRLRTKRCGRFLLNTLFRCWKISSLEEIGV